MRSSPSDGQPVSVQFQLQEGSAAAIFDFSLTAGSLQWNVNETGAKEILIGIREDQEVESTETFTVQIFNPVNATISRGTATVQIFDND